MNNNLIMDFKYLHVIRKEVWNSLDVFNVIVKNTDRNEHAFLLMGFKVNEIKGRGKKNLYYVPEDSKHSSVKKCMQLFHKAEFVIWHGIFANVNLLKRCCKEEKIFKKFVWISQGIDLYKWKLPTEKVDEDTKKKNMLINQYGEAFRKKILYFASAFPSDCIFFERFVNKYGRNFEISYLDNSWAKEIKQVLNNNKKGLGSTAIKTANFKRSGVNLHTNEKSLNLMIGVNSSKFNCHYDILNSLKNLCGENIVINIPIWSRNEKIDPGYIKKVIRYAKGIFGKKVVAKKLDSLQEYVEFLNKMDAVINRTTCAFPTYDGIYYDILTALSLGKVVFLHPESPIYRCMLNKKILVQNAKKIFGYKLEDLRNTILDNKDIKSKYIEDYINDSEHFGQFSTLIDSLSREHKHVKFLHVIRPSEEVSMPIVEIINGNFDVREHTFLMNRRIPSNSCAKFKAFSNIKLRLLGNTKLARLLYMKECLDKCDYIVWHGFYAGFGKPIMDVKELLLVSFFRKYLKKMTWVAWGADLYDWKADLRYFKGFKKLMVNFLNKLSESARRSIPNFVTLFPPDANKYIELFGNKATIYDGTYSNLHFAEFIEKSRPQKKKSANAPLDIMVGHSANAWNNHIEVLKNLAAYRNEKIRIIIPLSTGVNKAYCEQVMKVATKLFGKKAVFITKRMPINNYVKFLFNIDIAIFNMNRQAAIGNLMNLFYMGKKVFLPSDTAMYDFFRSQKINIFDTKKLPEIPFDEFKELKECGKPEYVLERTDPEKIVNKWRIIFDGISNNSNK